MKLVMKMMTSLDVVATSPMSKLTIVVKPSVKWKEMELGTEWSPVR